MVFSCFFFPPAGTHLRECSSASLGMGICVREIRYDKRYEQLDLPGKADHATLKGYAKGSHCLGRAKDGHDTRCGTGCPFLWKFLTLDILVHALRSEAPLLWGTRGLRRSTLRQRLRHSTAYTAIIFVEKFALAVTSLWRVTLVHLFAPTCDWSQVSRKIIGSLGSLWSAIVDVADCRLLGEPCNFPNP